MWVRNVSLAHVSVPLGNGNVVSLAHGERAYVLRSGEAVQRLLSQRILRRTAGPVTLPSHGGVQAIATHKAVVGAELAKDAGSSDGDSESFAKAVTEKKVKRRVTRRKATRK